MILPIQTNIHWSLVTEDSEVCYWTTTFDGSLECDGLQHLILSGVGYRVPNQMFSAEVPCKISANTATGNLTYWGQAQCLFTKINDDKAYLAYATVGMTFPAATSFTICLYSPTTPSLTGSVTNNAAAYLF